MANLLPKYAYLNDIKDMPATITEALKLYGTKETKGNGNNHVILKWAKELGIRDYNMDSIPWCGLFAAVVCSRAGQDVVKNPLWARNWANFGTAVPKAELGDVLVFVRNGGGHVGFYVGESPTTYHVLAGNQGDAVSIEEILKSRCVSRRRPHYDVCPACVKEYHVDAGGHVSTNEA